jgi:ABC-type antimicrobial peptide transport system permease subunit
VLIRAINSQRRLKPYFYSQSAKVGGIGCLFGFLVAYPLFFIIASSFGIDSDIPIRSYDSGTVMVVFTICFLILCLSLYSFCALTAFIYYGIKCKKGHIDRQELNNIVFKGIYPKRWQRGL